MNRKLRGLFYTIPGVVLGAAGMHGCSAVDAIAQAAGDVCGPCGTLATGDVGISGDARIDGFFSAVETLNGSIQQVKADFDANITALAALYNIDVSGGIDATAVGKLTAAIDAEVKANVTGGLQINYVPAQCHASISVAVNAEANCEAKAKCDVQANTGSVQVECKGECKGSCDAECSGNAQCAVDAPSVSCSGTCEGSCDLSAAAACSGTCHGTCSGKCDGTCTVTDAQGNCTGHCDGKCSANCQGSCELSAGASCTGKCTGKCVTSSGGAKCSAGAECRGECKGKCGGSCTGTATPPSASAKCDASADCQASASAQGSASLECTPPKLDVGFQVNASASASAQATFVAHMAEVKARGAAIVQGATKLKLLIQGDSSANIPAPTAQIQASLTALVSVDPTKFSVPVGKIPCVVPALTEAGKILASAATDLAGTISAQAKFVGYITTGTP